MRYFVIAFFILCMDQLSKKMIIFSLDHQEQLRVFSWLDIVHIHNRGAAFSLFANTPWAQSFFLIFGIIVIILLCIWIWRWNEQDPWLQRLALAFILGGACGNIADRIQYGFVIDFISVHYKNWYYPSFNVADSAITLGAFIILFLLLKSKNKLPVPKDSSPSISEEEKKIK